jgi:hypothetical protein
MYPHLQPARTYPMPRPQLHCLNSCHGCDNLATHKIPITPGSLVQAVYFRVTSSSPYPRIVFRLALLPVHSYRNGLLVPPTAGDHDDCTHGRVSSTRPHSSCPPCPLQPHLITTDLLSPHHSFCSKEGASALDTCVVVSLYEIAQPPSCIILYVIHYSDSKCMST